MTDKPAYFFSFGEGRWPDVCSICGAMVDNSKEAKTIHDDWHKEMEAAVAWRRAVTGR